MILTNPSVKDATTYQQRVERHRIFDFRAGLHDSYEPMAVQIFTKDPLPPLDEVYSYLHQEKVNCDIIRHQTCIHIDQRWPYSPKNFKSNKLQNGYGIAFNSPTHTKQPLTSNKAPSNHAANNPVL